MQPNTKGLEVRKIEFKILGIKEMILPEINAENIKKYFGDKVEVEDEKELREYIKLEIEKQKFDTELLKGVDGYLRKVQKNSMEVAIPQTLVAQEYASRFKNLEQRFGGAENAKQYLESLSDEKRKAFKEDVKKASKESLQKFFVLQKVCEHFKIDLNANNKAMEAKKQLYDKLS